jgi:uncharacterized protein with FMN-binding domain
LESSKLYTFQKSTEKRRGYLGSTAAIVVASILGGFGISSWLNPAPVVPSPSASEAAVEGEQTVAGDVINKGYGDVQVQITFANSAISKIEMLKAESTGNRQAAYPMLIKAALAANGPDVQNVSNATYSSEAFRESLQSALDKLR